ncbi:hypothetical protein [Streptomyces sp. NBC_01727]|uniref:hypothetical protein n=1 Tax=Streptomyces sp. NBC_01727 TaxID=2975924 RepID=UPI002E16700E|nr:hypothetical protein OIE76_40335 [Streptomyces sp. NBC_01727]
MMTRPILAAELAMAWADIQKHHVELPDLAAPESLINETSSACGPGPSFERLLHEAVHGVAAVRGIRDTSRAGRYHNRRFLAVAYELGLDHPTEAHVSTGLSSVRMRADTQRLYRSTVARLQLALDAYSEDVYEAGSVFLGPAARFGTSGAGVRVKAVCRCGRNLRVVRSVLVKAPILCGRCGEPFVTPTPGEEQEFPSNGGSIDHGDAK